MMKQLVFYFLILCESATYAQTVILDVDRREQQRKTEFGPNLKRFAQLTMRIGTLASRDKPGAKIIYENSINLAIGVRRKIKISRSYSLGYDVDLQFTDYKFKQEKGKIFPDTIIYNTSQRLDYSSISLGVFNRINFDPGRGNYLGTFLDLGINSMFDYSVKQISKAEIKGGIHEKTTLTHLLFVNNFNANVYARFGKSHFSFYDGYRITDLFKSSYNYPDLPRLILGIDASPF